MVLSFVFTITFVSLVFIIAMSHDLPGKRGIRQRLGIVDEKAPTTKDLDPLSKKLCTAYSVGKMTAVDTGDMAAAAAASSCSSASVARLAQAAPTGPSGNANSSRSLRRSLAKFSDTDVKHLEPYICDIPLWDCEHQRQVMRPSAFLAVHEAYDLLIPHGIEDEYCSLDDQSQAGVHDDLQAWQTRVGAALTLPTLCICLWGDSAPMSHRDSLVLMTTRLLSGVHKFKLWVWACSKKSLCACGCKGRCTFQAVWQVLAWMFRALASGVWPSVDHRGEPWGDSRQHMYRASRAGSPLRFQGACTTKTGDWQWLKQALNLQGWSQLRAGSRLCWMCRATTVDAFTVTPVAPWRSSLTSMDDILCPTTRDQFVSDFWSIPGVSLRTIKPDWMHCVDIGILQSVMGCIFFDLWRELGGTYTHPERACSQLLHLVRTQARNLGVDCPIADLTIFMIRVKNKKKPRLRLKAAEGRYMAPILRAILVHHFDRDTPYKVLRFQCFDALCSCYDLFADWHGQDSSRRLGELARRHVLLYCELARTRTDRKMWVVQPKHHIFLHLAEGSVSNPILSWCYSEESSIGRAAKVVAAMARGHIVRMLIPRYILTRSFIEE